MKKLFKILIIYSPVILVFGQVAANLIYVAAPDLYSKWYPVIGTLFGMNLISAGLMVALTYHFKFCSVSRWAALAQVIFCLAYMAVPDNDLYNIIIQVTVGISAIVLTIISMAIYSERKWKQAQS